MTLDLQIPDSRIADQAAELVRTSSPEFLTNHCFRSYAWAVALADRDHVRFDAELLYVAAVLHDLGLVARFDTGRCFEEDGAAAAADLATAERWSDERREALAEAIRLHVAAEIALKDGPEAYLLARDRLRRHRTPPQRPHAADHRGGDCRIPAVRFQARLYGPDRGPSRAQAELLGRQGGNRRYRRAPRGRAVRVVGHVSYAPGLPAAK